jgi:hypothetical protein
MDRNPYLILGIPFGSSRDEAQAAFARRARPLRRQGDAGRGALTELTWALNEVDVALTDPSSAVDVYRIPADPHAFEANGTGLFSPGPELLARRDFDSENALLTLRDHAAKEILLAVITATVGITTLPEY